jgi:hypothetical protein
MALRRRLMNCWVPDMPILDLLQIAAGMLAVLISLKVRQRYRTSHE